MSWIKGRQVKGCQMSVMSGIKVGLFGLAVLFMVGGSRLGRPVLLQVGLGMLGLGFVAIGGEAMVTRRMATQRKSAGPSTYSGLGAVLYGIVFVWLGVALIAVAVALFLGAWQAMLHTTIRRPGFALLNLSFLLLAGGGTILTGPLEERPGANARPALRAISILRKAPGLILLLLALALLALGLLEIVFPATFDALGGGFLEVLFLEGPS